VPPDSRLFAIVYLPSARFVIGSGAPVQATELPFVSESYPETDVHDQPRPLRHPMIWAAQRSAIM